MDTLEFDKKADKLLKQQDIFLHWITIIVPTMVSAVNLANRIRATPMERSKKIAHLRQQMINMSWAMHLYNEMKKEIKYVEK